MNIDSLKLSAKQFLRAIQARDWHQFVQLLETKSPRNLFLRALLIGLLLSVPWQCSRIFYSTYFSAKPQQSTNAGSSLTLPSFENGSVTNMPNPKARRPIPKITQPKNEPIEPEVVTESPNTAPATQADQEAKIISQTIPKYPTNIFRKKNVSGTVVLKVLIDSTGATQDITIEKSSESKSLDRAARKAVSAWKFSPKIANGVAVPSELLIPIEFKTEQ